VVTAAVAASNGELSIVLVVLAALAGAVAGDNVSYALGPGLGRRVLDRLALGEKGREPTGADASGAFAVPGSSLSRASSRAAGARRRSPPAHRR
jgi:membrane protein DedA with SNARE-associated domain